MLFEFYSSYLISKMKTMKKLILNILFLFGITTLASAQAYDAVPMAVTPANQPENNAYYRSFQNAYASEVYKSYWAWDKASLAWVKRVELVVPAPYLPAINTDPRYKLPVNGAEICMADVCRVKPPSTARKQ
jgi:hypothetical protein